MSTLSPERLRELAQQMRDTALGTTGREMHVCVNSGDLADLLQAMQADGTTASAIAQAVDALIANHKWHEDYDDHGGYSGSELERQNLSALGALAALASTSTTPGAVARPLASPQPSTTEPKYFDAFLCRAWGETDLPSAALVPDWEGVRAFMVREWLGEEDATDYDGENTLDRVKAGFDEHEEDQRGGPFEIVFEIGGVSVERVTGWPWVGTAIVTKPQSEGDATC